MDAQTVACNALISYNGRKDRLDKFRHAWVAAAGKHSPQELAYVVHNSLQEGERQEFLAALLKLVALQQALGKALLVEVKQHPEQTARSAVARVASSSGTARTSLRLGAGPGVRISASFWERARRNPQRTQQQKGGRRRVMDRPELITFVREFLMRRSKETSRFCRTKAKHRKATHKYGPLWEMFWSSWRGGGVNSRKPGPTALARAPGFNPEAGPGPRAQSTAGSKPGPGLRFFPKRTAARKWSKAICSDKQI